MKNLHRHLLPALVVLGLGYPAARLFMYLDQPLRLACAAILLLLIGFLLVRINYFIQRRDVEERAVDAGLLRKKDSLGGALPKWPLPGYAAMLASAVVIAFGYAYAWQSSLMIAAGLAIYWWSDRAITLVSTQFLGERLEAASSPAAAAVGQSGRGARTAGAPDIQPASAVPPPDSSSPGTTEARAPASAQAINDALKRAIEEKKKEDPLIGAKLGARELNQRLIKAMKNEHGVHTESLLSTLGALAGYACQVSLRSEALSRGESANAPFTVVQASNGRRYFFGDPLNQRLAEGRYSVWNIATSTLRKEGLQALPELEPIFKHVTGSVGSEHFGIPRFPDGHNASDLPLNYVKDLWPVVLPVMKQYTPKPAEWPILFGFALQEVLRMSRDVLAPELALLVIMESAIPMSKVDLQTA